MAARRIVHLGVEQRRARGREARDRTAPSSHAGWAPAADRSIADFSERHADQNDQDYQAYAKAIRSGRLEALEGI